MKHIPARLTFLITATLGIHSVNAQKVTGKLQFNQGQVAEITMQVKTTIAQEAMGQAIDFNIDATGVHTFQVTNSTEENTTLNHRMKQVSFYFDGMGQKRKFDSREEKDINGPFGKPMKDLLEKKYDIIIDSNGRTLMAIPEKVVYGETDNRMALITSLLKDVTALVQPPAKGKPSFFQVLPDRETGVGDSWKDGYEDSTGKMNATYTVTGLNDTLIVVEFVINSVTTTKAEMMGNETVTTMNNKSTGKILLDRMTGIIREKIINTESSGTTEGPFGSVPVTSKTSTLITVRLL